MESIGIGCKDVPAAWGLGVACFLARRPDVISCCIAHLAGSDSDGKREKGVFYCFGPGEGGCWKGNAYISTASLRHMFYVAMSYRVALREVILVGWTHDGVL